MAEEMQPTRIVLETGIPDIDPQRLAGMLRLAFPSASLLLVCQHLYEARWWSTLDALGPPEVQLRPFDPVVLAGPDGESADTGVLGRGEGVVPASLAASIAELIREGASATVYLSDGLHRKILYVVDGRLRFAASNHFEELFGRFLLERGVVTDVDLDWARQLQLTQGVQQGEALQKIGVFRERDLRTFLELQIREKFIRAFAPDTTLRWRIVEGGQFMPQRDGYSISAVDVLSEALARYVPRSESAPPVPGSLHLRLATPVTDHLVDGLRAALAPDALRAMSEGRPIDEIARAGALDAHQCTSLLKALELLAIAMPVQRLEQVDQSLLRQHLGTSSPIMVRGVDERTREIRARLADANARDPFALLRVPRSASLDEINEAADGALAHFGHPEYAQHLPLETSMQLAELMDELRRARDLLQDPAQREKAQRRIRHTMPVQALDTSKAEESFTEGRQLLAAGDFAHAVARLGDAVQLDGTRNDFRIWHAFAVHRTAAGDEERHQARRAVLRVLERQPDLDDAYFLLGRMYDAEGDPREAAEQYRMALSINDGHADARAALAALGPG
ncbi:MAG: hypothetical protein EA398_09575 [Deltaproteobacteria bacterium]|nr:MAG: hypothetical protein EA398_09575 [Deltaproteobacteria bacterium]